MTTRQQTTDHRQRDDHQYALNRGPGRQLTTDNRQLNKPRYALRREANSWEVTFEGRQANLKHELGALYVAYLLLHPSREPLHGVALALHAREKLGQPASPAEVQQQRGMGLEDAAAVRALWRHQRELERILHDRLEIEPVKAEAQRELEEITEHLRKSPWLIATATARAQRSAPCRLIPDIYCYMEPALIDELKAALSGHVEVPE